MNIKQVAFEEGVSLQTIYHRIKVGGLENARKKPKEDRNIYKVYDKWKVMLNRKRVKYVLGSFKTFEEAKAARDEFLEKYEKGLI